MHFNTPNGPLLQEITDVIVAGWTGRDRAAVDHHIEELAALGVAPPSTVPLFYRVSSGLLCHDTAIQVVGTETSGEVEPLVIRSGGQQWLGLGSDHTDRALETVSVAASKQVCPKPVSRMLWPWVEIEDHLDQLVLHCDVEEDGKTVRYQDGTLASIRPLDELIDGSGLADGGAMLCGTLGAIGGVRPATNYRMSLIDPVLNRTISLGYSVRVLPVIA
ncbi:MAG: DUF2848 domain-containing protein [Dinoroseobacter sp.]|nr:DUF2848 domain-containing protein [Dinoroseobacter sp.]